MKWVLTFDGIPPGPNERLNRFDRAESNRNWRAASRLKTGNLRIPVQDRIRVSVCFRRRNLGTADVDNDLSRCKPIVDGIVDAGVVKGDSRKYVSWGEVTEEHGAPGFVLIIEAGPTGADEKTPTPRDATSGKRNTGGRVQ